MLISIKAREMLDHKGHNRETTTRDTTRISTCKETCNNTRSRTWDKEGHQVCQSHLRTRIWVCPNNQCQQVCQWLHLSNQEWHQCQECHLSQHSQAWTISKESIWHLSRDTSRLLRRSFHPALRETHTWKNKLVQPFLSLCPCMSHKKKLQRLLVCWSNCQSTRSRAIFKTTLPSVQR